MQQCGECGFDETKWYQRDVESLLRATPEWRRLALAGVDPLAFSPAPPAGENAHGVGHWMMEVAEELSRRGLGTPPGAGRVAQVNVSKGGVPKTPVDRAEVDWNGVAGDRQKDRRHHGRQFQALCLWSTEVLDELAGDGHPIAPGSAGENLTLTGVDWASLRPGSRLQLGTALAEISFVAVPCKKQAQWFSDGDFRRIAYEENPQWVRWYAWVRRPGEVAAGDEVVVQPPL